MEDREIVNCESELLPAGKVVSRVGLFVCGADGIAKGKKMRACRCDGYSAF